MPNNDQIFTSFDGSDTIVNEKFNVPYHSKHGAITESTVIFIEAGLQYIHDQGVTEISIFEMGFGTGLNALLSYKWAKERDVTINYHTIEAYPLVAETLQNLNYTDILGEQKLFNAIHQCTWGDVHLLGDRFHFCKHLSMIEDFQTKLSVDVVFYDAFAPSSQPHLWTSPVLDKMYEFLNPNGALVSYCAQGAFKRNLKSLGFKVKGLPGPPGKREITRGIKS